MSEIRIAPSQMDLGKISGTEPKDFWFSVTNVSDKTIKCTPWASCGCTTPQLLPSILAPQEHAKLKVQFDPVGKTGLQEKNLGVQYEIDGKLKSISVIFTAEI